MMWQPDMPMRSRGTHWAGWVIFAILLHGGLLAAASRFHTPMLRTIELVRVSLIGEREGGGGHAGAAAAAPPEPQAAAPVPEVIPLPAPARPQATHRLSARPPLKHHAPAVAPSAPSVTESSAAAPSGDAVTATTGGYGAGQGSGEGGAGAASGHAAGAGGGEADQRGYCVDCPEPGYPMIARRRGWSGRVDVSLILLADGRVDRASVTRSSGYDVLDHEALAVAHRSRFRIANPSAAPVQGHIEYRFELVP